MKYGYSRHSVLAPILIGVIVVCVAAIGVLTWALFRVGAGDDGKIGTNVTSGKVKIDIEDTDGNSLIGDAFEFVTPDGSESVIFAPGYTYHTEGFRVRNEGNLEIKYRVSVSEDESINSTAFAEAFDVYITKDPNNLDTAEKLTTFAGSLNVNATSDVYYLVVAMKDNASDEFQDRTFTGIGITVHATQVNAPGEP